MKRIYWMVALLLACLLLPAAVAEDIPAGDVEAENAEAAAFDLFDDAAQVISKAATSVYEFPDETFRAWVAAHCDLKGDGVISDSEASAVTAIDVSGMDIGSLAGIERFAYLQTLNCADNRLTELNLAGNPSLTTLNCGDNGILLLDLSANYTLRDAVTTLCPSVSGENMVFQKKSKKTTTTIATLPLGCAIVLDNKVFYSPDEDLELSQEEAQLGVKQTLKLLPEDPTWPLAYCTFETTNKKIAKVSDKGVVTAGKVGEATVTVSIFDGRSVECEVEVLKAPSKVTLSATSLTLGVDETAELEVELPDGTASSITWSSSNPGVAIIDEEEGELVTLNPGKTTITAKTFNGKKASCTVTVGAAPSYVSLNVSNYSMMYMQTATLTPILPQGTGGSLTWVSSNPAVVSIDEDTGLMEALAEGEATITVTTYNDMTAECVVTVTPGPDSIALGVDPSVKVAVGDTLFLDAEALRGDGVEVGQQLDYVSSNTKYATVSSTGVVQGKKKGKATITVSAPNGVKAVCDVSVVKAPSSIKLNKKTLTLGAGDSERLTVSMSSSAYSAITWSGYDDTVIEVDEDGTVTGLAAGTTTVTASTFNGKKASCTVTVTKSAQEIADYTATHKLIAVAHRGGRAYWEENTLEAFSHSASTGATMIELDVQTTSDGVQVINHDSSIKVNDKTYKIPSNTYSTLVSVKPSMCTLDEALELIYTTGLDIQLELKESADAAKCVAVVAKHNMADRTWYISFKTKQLQSVRALDATARLGYIFEKSIPSDLNATIASLNISALMVQKDLLTQERLDNWHRMGLLVNAWTCNTREECKKFANMGVDFITSDYPDYAAEVAR